MNKTISMLSAITMMVLSVGSASASTISLVPLSLPAAIGDSIEFNLTVDFSDDPTLGGGMDIAYDDNLLSFQSFDFGTATAALDPSFSRLPDHPFAYKLEGLAFGSFTGITTGIVGTLTFQAIAEGSALIEMGVTSDPLKGGDFYSAVTYQQQNPTFNNLSVQISSVPLPGAIWLFGSGVLSLAGMARRHSKIEG